MTRGWRSRLWPVDSSRRGGGFVTFRPILWPVLSSRSILEAFPGSLSLSITGEQVAVGWRTARKSEDLKQRSFRRHVDAFVIASRR